MIESLQISNDCLQKKVDSASYLINQEDNYTALKTKYRKFLTEFKDLKKSYDILQKEQLVFLKILLAIYRKRLSFRFYQIVDKIFCLVLED